MIVSDERLMDTEEVARYLNVHFKTVINLVRRGDLIASKVGRDWRYRKSDVDNFLERQQNISRSDDRY